MVSEDTLLMLIDALKVRLDITWSDEATDSKIKQLLSDSIAWLVQSTGYRDLDYSQNTIERELMFTRVQYAMENMLDDFSTNYKSEIVAMINRAKVRKYNASTQNADTNTSI